MEYEVQYVSKDGECAGYEVVPTLQVAREVLTAHLKQFLPPNYVPHYAGIVNVDTGESISAYRTTPEGVVRQIALEELPEC